MAQHAKNLSTYQTEGCSGAEAVALCQEAALVAMEEDLEATEVTLSVVLINSTRICHTYSFSLILPFCLSSSGEPIPFHQGPRIIYATHHTGNDCVLRWVPKAGGSEERVGGVAVCGVAVFACGENL